MKASFALTALALGIAAATPAAGLAGGGLVIEGAVSRPVTFSGPQLASLPHVGVKRIDHGQQVDCEGVPLADLLRHAGLPVGESLRGSALTIVLIASAADGYKVALTLGELDPSLGNAGAVVADRCGGKLLPKETGPLRLVLPRDNRPARSVRQLERITILPRR